MLRVNVGLSRKVSKDYNSTGFSVNLDGEVTAPISDAEGVIEQVKELFDVAEEALNQQIERHNGESAIASRDEEPSQKAPTNQNGNGSSRPNRTSPRRTPAATNGNANGNGHANGEGNGNGHANGDGNGKPIEPATNKQIQYLLSIGKRQRLTTVQLEKKIAEIVGRPVGVYDLSKMAAGIVIDALTNGAAANGTQAR